MSHVTWTAYLEGGGGMRKGITIPQPLIFIHSLNRDFGFRNQQRLATGRVQIRIADVC